MKMLAYWFNTPLELADMTNGYQFYRNQASYDRWANTEHGQWCIENNIQPISADPQYDPRQFAYYYHFYIDLTDEQKYEYDQITFFNKLTEPPFNDNF